MKILVSMAQLHAGAWRKPCRTLLTKLHLLQGTGAMPPPRAWALEHDDNVRTEAPLTAIWGVWLIGYIVLGIWFIRRSHKDVIAVRDPISVIVSCIAMWTNLIPVRDRSGTTAERGSLSRPFTLLRLVVDWE